MLPYLLSMVRSLNKPLAALLDTGIRLFFGRKQTAFAELYTAVGVGKAQGRKPSRYLYDCDLPNKAAAFHDKGSIAWIILFRHFETTLSICFAYKQIPSRPPHFKSILGKPWGIILHLD